jgi:hypothetical protein
MRIEHATPDLKMQNYESAPDNLPIPKDDGAADHLPGLRLPDVVLPTTQGDTLALAKLKMVGYFFTNFS